jgi:hypothetical protein
MISRELRFVVDRLHRDMPWVLSTRYKAEFALAHMADAFVGEEDASTISNEDLVSCRDVPIDAWIAQDAWWSLGLWDGHGYHVENDEGFASPKVVLPFAMRN